MKPYKRIIRPLSLNHFGHYHLLDHRYCTERVQLIHAYHIIEDDFRKLFDYVELHDNNNSTFSHRIFELLLRTCTEFENNCKGILIDNGYTKSENFNIKDYLKINSAARLNEYEVRLNVWSPQALVIQPFSEWNNSAYSPLIWYQNYNHVKHDRSLSFHEASLQTLVKSMAGLFTILAAQFYHQIFSQFQVNVMTYVDDDEFASANDSIFSIKFPQSWTNNDFYSFDWETIKSEVHPFEKYNFN